VLQVIEGIAHATSTIAAHLLTANGDTAAGSTNSFGDHQLEIDLHADEVIFNALRASGAVVVAASEEKPSEQDMGGGSVGFDPLDGSSIIDTNFTVGSIFGVWPGKGMLGQTGRQQSAALMSVYGPRTHLVIALPASVTGYKAVCFDLQLHPQQGAWAVSHRALSIAPAGKVFAPGNLRATSDNPNYMSLIQHWVTERYTLRYSGGMVPDVYHILIKGKGVFSNVSSATAKAKLRLVYECAPLALLVEAAGGATLVAPSAGEANPSPISVLDIKIEDLDQRMGVFYGGTEEVELCRKHMFPSCSK
ncbi:unnamed protein product, partial [Chrysoparadoxa australica]